MASIMSSEAAVLGLRSLMISLVKPLVIITSKNGRKMELGTRCMMLCESNVESKWVALKPRPLLFLIANP